VTAVVRNLFRTTTTDVPAETAEPVDYCQCNRGPVIGAVIAYTDHLLFFPLSNKKAEWPENVTYLRCVDCLADISMDVTNGVIEERMKKLARERAESMAVLMRRNEMRRASGLPIAVGLDEDGTEKFVGGQR
jgi:formate-dependent nitrite reductase cytochrome c552 subunit